MDSITLKAHKTIFFSFWDWHFKIALLFLTETNTSEPKVGLWTEMISQTWSSVSKDDIITGSRSRKRLCERLRWWPSGYSSGDDERNGLISLVVLRVTALSRTEDLALLQNKHNSFSSTGKPKMPPMIPWSNNIYISVYRSIVDPHEFFYLWIGPHTIIYL